MRTEANARSAPAVSMVLAPKVQKDENDYKNNRSDGNQVSNHAEDRNHDVLIFENDPSVGSVPSN